MRSDASTRAASTKVGSLSSVSACCGVFATVRLGGALLARRGVEVGQHRVQERPLPVHVDAAAVLPLVGVRRRSRGRGTAGWRSSRPAGTGLTLGPPSSRFEQAGDGQRVVADELGLEPPRRLGREQPVVRVDVAQLRPRPASPAGRWPTSPSAGPCASRPSRSRGTRRPASRAAPDATAIRPGRRGRPRRALRPVPKNCFQSRLTNTRAVSGFSGDASQFARSSRVSRSAVGSARLRQEVRHRRLHDRAALVLPVAARQDAR